MLEWLYSQGDNLNHNFCRFADPLDPKPWCYTTDPNVRFDYCDCSGLAWGSMIGPMSRPISGPISGPICQPDAGTITRPFSFEYTIYDSSASVTGTRNGNLNRIFGGRDATRGEVPWQVNLFIDRKKLENLTCGGTLISSTVRFLPNVKLRKGGCGTLLLLPSRILIEFSFVILDFQCEGSAKNVNNNRIRHFTS